MAQPPAPREPAAPRRAQSKSQIDGSNRDLDAINRKLAAELRAALAGEAKANEARVVAENKIEHLRIEMGQMIKAARQQGPNSPAGDKAGAGAAAGAAGAGAGAARSSLGGGADEASEVKRLTEELAAEKQQSAMLRKNLEARSKETAPAKVEQSEMKRAKDELELERRQRTALQALLAERTREAEAARAEAAEHKKLKEELAAERQLSSSMRKELSERNREALAAKSESGEAKKLRDELAAERATTGQLRRELGERSKELTALSGESEQAARLKEELAGQQQLVAALRKELSERNREALAGKASQVAQAGRAPAGGLSDEAQAKAEAAAREKEIERLSGELARLGTLLGGKVRERNKCFFFKKNGTRTRQLLI